MPQQSDSASPLLSRFCRPLNAFLVCAALSLSSAALAAPSFSGPSVGKVSQATVFSGKGFVPNAALTVLVKRPGGAEAGFSAVATPEGALSYSFVPAASGVHALTVTDSAGRSLATAVLNARP
ncbi:hypothetical protein [Paucibacter sp. XJ19-41]|uniref:hypothetical protein n=1 Tax=Paucibacter sp. XJ19-41 TaxID=2927824 RepID=UPI00234BE933|nr:hypothetical protein [Paucibacter sp. XJ19-41]MDC6170209.1 hypothetical protein [Paucibacter sp. XJ19-41]